MPLTAIRAATQEIVEAFDITPERWRDMQNEPVGSYLVRRSGLPAILKKNQAGTQWFSARPGEADPAWKPTSIEHEFAQVQLVKALRSIGISARLEEPGHTPTGERWEADVFFEHAGRNIAIEVQLSQQTMDEYERRSEKYLKSGVKVVWLINSRHFESYSIGCVASNGRKLGNGSIGPILNGEQHHRRFPGFPLTFNCPKGFPTVDATTVTVYLPPDGWPVKKLSLRDFAVGLANGALIQTQGKFWTWTTVRPKAVFQNI